MAFTSKHYVPVLKTKKGEQWAIANLPSDARDRMRPVFELHKHKETADDPHAVAVVKAVAKNWGTTFECYLDPIFLSSPTVLDAAFGEARSSKLKAIPVVRVSSGLPILQAAKTIIQQDNRGVMVRLRIDDLVGCHGSLAVLASFLGVTESDVDLLIDYERHAMSLSKDLPKIPNLAAWRSVGATSGVFPDSLSPLPLMTWQAIPRHCWATWNSARASGSLPRIPAFGDYGTRTPGPPATGGEPSVNIRYTTPANWLTKVGGKLKDGDASDMQVICADLVNQPFYSGPVFSRGDEIFNAVAGRSASTGGSTEWVQWSLNHHLVLVSRQLGSAFAHSVPAGFPSAAPGGAP